MNKIVKLNTYFVLRYFGRFHYRSDIYSQYFMERLNVKEILIINLLNSFWNQKFHYESDSNKSNVLIDKFRILRISLIKWNSKSIDQFFVLYFFFIFKKTRIASSMLDLLMINFNHVYLGIKISSNRFWKNIVFGSIDKIWKLILEISFLNICFFVTLIRLSKHF